VKRTPLKRRAPLARSNRKRRAASYAKNFGERADAVRAMPCLVPDCSAPSVAAHARARGMGGCKGDRRCLVPLCQEHHVAAGEARTSQRADFERTHGVDLVAEAEWLAVELDRMGLP
jgi:hypothetical protein